MHGEDEWYLENISASFEFVWSVHHGCITHTCMPSLSASFCHRRCVRIVFIGSGWRWDLYTLCVYIHAVICSHIYVALYAAVLHLCCVGCHNFVHAWPSVLINFLIHMFPSCLNNSLCGGCLLANVWLYCNSATTVCRHVQMLQMWHVTKWQHHPVYRYALSMWSSQYTVSSFL